MNYWSNVIFRLCQKNVPVWFKVATSKHVRDVPSSTLTSLTVCQHSQGLLKEIQIHHVVVLMKCAVKFAATLCSGARLVGWTDQRRGWWKARQITLTSADLVTSCASRSWAVGQQSSHLVHFAFYAPHLYSAVFFSFFTLGKWEELLHL